MHNHLVTHSLNIKFLYGTRSSMIIDEELSGWEVRFICYIMASLFGRYVNVFV